MAAGISRRQLTQSTPAQVAGNFGDNGLAELAYLRFNPADLQTRMIKPIQVAEDSLRASLIAYQNYECLLLVVSC